MIQNIDTIPSAFPLSLNTCGRICSHPSGRFVIVSNRGHESIAILKVREGGERLETNENRRHSQRTREPTSYD